MIFSFSDVRLKKGEKMDKAENGSMVTVHYTGTLNDGTEFDSSRNGAPLNFKIGEGQVIPGFNDALVGMTLGDTKTIFIESENAYGPKNEAAIQEVPLDRFPENFEAIPGETVNGQTKTGQDFVARIISNTDTAIVLDFNHPLAGEDLTFEVELLTITQ
jgi:FKBP-type peptidyl-prolyl cis-trans isomerase 2